MAAAGRSQDDTGLLLTLGEVSEIVSNSHDLQQTLTNIVHHILERFGTDVASVYTVDRESDELVLSATVGLQSAAVNQVRMAFNQGLVGLSAESKLPVNVADAPAHPRFRYFPECGEDAYHSFLAVPMIQGGVVQGVLVVQGKEPRRFTASEVRLLKGVAAQLAILVTNAKLLRDLSDVVRDDRKIETPKPPAEKSMVRLYCTSASPGYGHGSALRFEVFDFENPKLIARNAGTVEEERQLLANALEQGRENINRGAAHLAELLGEQFGALMQAQRLMLEDYSLQQDLHCLIDDGRSVEQAVIEVCSNYLRAFAKLDNPFFYERIYDIKDVFRRLLSFACPSALPAAQALAVIVVAHEVSLLELFASDLSRVKGIVVEKGGTHSHVAILAKSLRIPMLTHAPQLLDRVADGDELFVDGSTGVAYANPSAARREICLKILREHQKPPIDNKFPDPPIRLETTVNLMPEVGRTVQFGGQAVGLYRSEFLELARRSFPSEDEQVEIYRKMVSILAGRPLTIRTLDLRTDKLYSASAEIHAEDQSWDWRLVDRLPHVQDLVRTQIRAILRAAESGPVRILFPMIVTQRQLDSALKLIHEARKSLDEEQLPYGKTVPLGLMVEVPAAAMMARAWAHNVDFLCVGSNDLLHSLLGIERNEDQLQSLKTPLDPSYLRTVRHIIKHADAVKRPVTICGEAASHPKACLALYALGADALSVPPDSLNDVRRYFAEVHMPKDLENVSRQILGAAHIDQIEQIIDRWFPIKPDPASDI